MTFMRFIHKWIGLFLGLQLILWMVSGFMMSWLDHNVVEGHHLRNEHGAGHAPVALSSFGGARDPGALVAQLPKMETLKAIDLQAFRGSAVYAIRTDQATRFFNAKTGTPVVITSSLAAQIAQEDYAGTGSVKNISAITAPTMETRENTGPGWRVDFDDDENSSFYLSAETGSVWERRQDTWRTFDIFWMLHIMDYENRKDFNNMFVILSGWIVLWLVLSGMIMLIENFKRGDFNVVAGVREQGLAKRLMVKDGTSTSERQIVSTGRKTLFDALAVEDIHLPSTCGGGGSCGLCRVQMNPSPSPTAADIRQIPKSELKLGYRLTCQHMAVDDLVINLPKDLLAARDFEVEVTEARFVTPFIREIRVKPTSDHSMSFRPGSYMQVTIPACQISLDDLEHAPKVFRDAWVASGASRHVVTDQPLHRTYSMANAPSETEGEFILNVRIALPQGVETGVPVGMGSTYMNNLKVGDKLTVRGPFGDFALKENKREKIFIGGGAGMAPLRSMILHLLQEKNTSAPISFWYGARTVTDIYYKETFDRLQKDFPNFQWYTALSEAEDDQGWHGKEGFIHEVVQREYLLKHPDLGICDFYLCGPPKMLEATMAMLAALGVREEQIAFDDFGI